MFEKLKSFDESTIQLRLLIGSVRYIYINLIQSSQTCPINVIKVCQTKHSVKGMIKHLDWFKKNKKPAVCQSFESYLKILKTYKIPTSFDENTYQKHAS